MSKVLGKNKFQIEHTCVIGLKDGVPNLVAIATFSVPKMIYEHTYEELKAGTTNIVERYAEQYYRGADCSTLDKVCFRCALKLKSIKIVNGENSSSFDFDIDRYKQFNNDLQRISSGLIEFTASFIYGKHFKGQY